MDDANKVESPAAILGRKGGKVKSAAKSAASYARNARLKAEGKPVGRRPKVYAIEYKRSAVWIPEKNNHGDPDIYTGKMAAMEAVKFHQQCNPGYAWRAVPVNEGGGK
jgi:hypothetical protein